MSPGDVMALPVSKNHARKFVNRAVVVIREETDFLGVKQALRAFRYNPRPWYEPPKPQGNRPARSASKALMDDRDHWLTGDMGDADFLADPGRFQGAAGQETDEDIALADGRLDFFRHLPGAVHALPIHEYVDAM